MAVHREHAVVAPGDGVVVRHVRVGGEIDARAEQRRTVRLEDVEPLDMLAVSPVEKSFGQGVTAQVHAAI